MRVVLDTNVVLDWLVFQEIALEPLRHAVRDGRVSLLAHASALDELLRVLQYPRLRLEVQQQERVLKQYSELTQLFEHRAERQELPRGFPCCSDPDDDHFLSLAYLARADALVSKDRQVLVLKKRMAKFGVRVLTPQQFMLSAT